MSALVRYQLALLVRSQRWLPPLLVYAAVLAVTLRPGDPVLDALGLATAALLPVAAWLVRVCATLEPSAARACAAAASSPGRVHFAALLAALAAATVLGVAGLGVSAWIADPYGTDRQTSVSQGAALGAGLLAMLTCALTGGAVGALCNRPVLHGTAWAVPATVTAAAAVLVVGASPANAAVSGLVTGSDSAQAPVPLLPVCLAAVCAAGAAWLTCALSSRRP